MFLVRTASATCLLIALAIPALAGSAGAETCWNRAGSNAVHRHVAPDGALRHPREADRAPARKLRICYRPDAGRYSRLIPYEC